MKNGIMGLYNNVMYKVYTRDLNGSQTANDRYWQKISFNCLLNVFKICLFFCTFAHFRAFEFFAFNFFTEHFLNQQQIT
jgi:hypothetical protein